MASRFALTAALSLMVGAVGAQEVDQEIAQLFKKWSDERQRRLSEMRARKSDALASGTRTLASG